MEYYYACMTAQYGHSLSVQLVFKRKVQVLNDMLCREPAESTRAALTQGLDQIKVSITIVEDF